MKMYFVEKFSEGDADRQVEAMRNHFTFTNLEEADVIYCASIVTMTQAIGARLTSHKPMVVYCWDYYLWAHAGKHHNHNWKQYADFLRMATLILVPSHAQQLRLKELLGLDSVVVKTGIPTYSHKVSDAGFILDPLRYYPEEQSHWAEKAAGELGIPIIHSEHQYSEEEFRKLVASCSFLTSCVQEASTGSLTLMEGLNLGKVSLVSDSPYQGAKDYIGPYGVYFSDYDDLKKKMADLWERRPKVRAVNYMKDFTYNVMAKNLYESICRYT